MELSRSSLIHDLSLIRIQAPVVFSLTNQVAMDLNANALLAIGASPLMSAEPAETAEVENWARRAGSDDRGQVRRWQEGRPRSACEGGRGGLLVEAR